MYTTCDGSDWAERPCLLKLLDYYNDVLEAIEVEQECYIDLAKAFNNVTMEW